MRVSRSRSTLVRRHLKIFRYRFLPRWYPQLLRSSLERLELDKVVVWICENLVVISVVLVQVRSSLVFLVQVLHVLIDLFLHLRFSQLLRRHVLLLADLPSSVCVALAVLHIDREPLSRLQSLPEVKQISWLPHVPRRTDKYVCLLRDERARASQLLRALCNGLRPGRLEQRKQKRERGADVLG